MMATTASARTEDTGEHIEDAQGKECPIEMTPDGKAAPFGNLGELRELPEEGPTGEMSA